MICADAPSLDIIPALQQAGASISAYDPEAMSEARKWLDDVGYSDNAYDCLDGADALVIITEWDSFRALDLLRVKAQMKTPIVVDLRNIYRADENDAAWF